MSLIILIRHGSAERFGVEGDVSRNLTDHGRDQARRLGVDLAALAGPVDTAVVSHAVRAQQTADLVLESVKAGERLVDSTIYSGGCDEMIEIINAALGESVMIVGHEPTISHCACVLDPSQDLWGVPTATALIIDCDKPLAQVRGGDCQLRTNVHAQ